jgi:hypothetical protein
VLTSLVVMPLALIAFLALWPVVLVAVVLFLVAVIPFVAVGAGVRAILAHGHRVIG